MYDETPLTLSLSYLYTSISISLSRFLTGSVASKERQRIIDEFNDTSDDNTGPSVCLLTTRGIQSHIHSSIHPSIPPIYLSSTQLSTTHLPIHHPHHPPSDLCTCQLHTACGLGITLTGADRVIIYDPCKRCMYFEWSTAWMDKYMDG